MNSLQEFQTSNTSMSPYSCRFCRQLFLDYRKFEKSYCAIILQASSLHHSSLQKCNQKCFVQKLFLFIIPIPQSLVPVNPKDLLIYCFPHNTNHIPSFFYILSLFSFIINIEMFYIAKSTCLC